MSKKGVLEPLSTPYVASSYWSSLSLFLDLAPLFSFSKSFHDWNWNHLDGFFVSEFLYWFEPCKSHLCTSSMNHTSRLINRIPPRRLLPRPERKGIVEMRAGNQELSFRKSRLVSSPRLFVVCIFVSKSSFFFSVKFQSLMCFVRFRSRG